jgi:hypothetical protein
MIEALNVKEPSRYFEPFRQLWRVLGRNANVARTLKIVVIITHVSSNILPASPTDLL